MISAVCDTNIFISALLFPGSKPDHILQMARTGQIRLFVSNDILDEVAHVLQQKFRLSERQIWEYTDMVCGFSEIVKSARTIDLIAAADADNRILECAEAAKVQYLITGDKKHLLPLERFGKTIILSASEFLRIFKHTGKRNPKNKS